MFGWPRKQLIIIAFLASLNGNLESSYIPSCFPACTLNALCCGSRHTICQTGCQKEQGYDTDPIHAVLLYTLGTSILK